MQWEGDAAQHGGASGGTAEQVRVWGRMLSGGSWPRILLPCTSALNNGAVVSLFGKGNGHSIMSWPCILWYLILESQKSLLFVNGPLSYRQRDTYAANKH